MEKKLYRIEEGKTLCGVCGGIAKYLNVDPTVVRVIWTLFSCCGGAGILAYIVCALIIPKEPNNVIEGHWNGE